MKGKRPSLEGSVKREVSAAPVGREGKKRMTVHLDPEMHKKLRHLALDLDQSAEAVIIDAITARLQKHQSS